jgi:hypothetical protein
VRVERFPGVVSQLEQPAKAVRTMPRRSLLPDDDPIHRVDHHSAAAQPPGAVMATDDHELIREWAARARVSANAAS